MIKMPIEPSFPPVTDNLTGGDCNDVFTVAEGDLEGNAFEGRGGIDTLQLEGGGTFDLTRTRVFSGIEIVRGSGEHDTIILREDQLPGIATLNGGERPETYWDEIVLHGDTFDFRAKTLIGIDRLSLKTDNAIVTVADAATALLVSGLDTQNDRLVAANVIFSDSEIETLHRQGIDTVVDAAGAHPNIRGSAS